MSTPADGGQAGDQVVMNWVKLHPTNIAQKVRSSSSTSARTSAAAGRQGQGDGGHRSRKAAVRYKLAFDKYVADQGYTDVAALVAFSGEVDSTRRRRWRIHREASMNPGLRAATCAMRSPPTNTT